MLVMRCHLTHSTMITRYDVGISEDGVCVCVRCRLIFFAEGAAQAISRTVRQKRKKKGVAEIRRKKKEESE